MKLPARSWRVINACVFVFYLLTFVSGLTRRLYSQSITYMANTDPFFSLNPAENAPEAPSASEKDAQLQRIREAEARVVMAWGAYCPSLRTVVLPRGQVWFKRPLTVPRAPPAGSDSAAKEGGGGMLYHEDGCSCGHRDSDFTLSTWSCDE